MVDLTEITLHDGIPVAGDGEVATINALMADGGLATVGFKADQASTATDSTPTTLMQVLKQVSKTLQAINALLPTALAATGGLKVQGDGTAIPISGSVTSTANDGYVGVASFTCGTSAYAQYDVVGAGGGNAALQFSTVAPGAATILIYSASLEIDRDALISGEGTYRLYLYNVTPPSALADSSAWDLSVAGDRSAFLGYIDFTAPVDLGSTLYVELNNINKVIKTASANVYGYLVNTNAGGFTPTAALYKITLGVRRL